MQHDAFESGQGVGGGTGNESTADRNRAESGRWAA